MLLLSFLVLRIFDFYLYLYKQSGSLEIDKITAFENGIGLTISIPCLCFDGLSEFFLTVSFSKKKEDMIAPKLRYDV